MTQASQLSLIESSTGTITISNTGSSALTIAGGVIVAGQISGGGTRTTSASTPPSNPGVGDIWYNTLTDTVARYTSDGVTSVWLDITGPTVTNAFNGGTVTQSIIPNATASYDLGSSAYRFRTLYLTSSTIDINGGALISSVTALAGAVSGTPSSTTYLRGDATWATISTPGGGGTVSTGTVVLTSSSSASQSITSTTWGQTVTLPAATTLSTGANLYNINNTGGYPLTILDNAGNILGFAYPYSAVIVGLASNSTAAGVWNLSGHELLALTAESYISNGGYNLYQAITLDSTRTLIILGINANTYGIIWDASSQTFGTTTLISSTYGGGQSYAFAAILTTTNQVLICHGDGSTTLAAVVLTLSGTTITVGTYATATVTSINNGQAAMIISQGSSWVFQYGGTSTLNIVAITISGTTPTIGTPTALSGTSNNYGNISSISSSVLLSVSYTASTTIYATPYTVSGTTITAGTGATVSTAATAGFRILPISSGARRVIAYSASGGATIAGTVISVSGTTATMSTVTLATSAATTISGNDMIVSGSKLIFHQCGAGFQILTDTAGTASVGTFLSFTPGGSTGATVALSATNNIATFAVNSGNFSGTVFKANINFSTASPTLVAYDLINMTTSVTLQIAWSNTNAPTSSSGIRPNNSLFGTINIFLNASAIKYGFVNQGATLAYTPKFTLPVTLVGAVTYCVIGANNELWMTYVGNPSTLFRVQSIT